MLRIAPTTAAIAIEVAQPTDMAAIRALLDRAHLPTGDLVGAHDVRFWVGRAAGHLIGAVGLERFGDVALLRSLVVAPEARGTGLGSALTDAAEAAASADGIHDLYLLTQTAERFFARRGYAVVKRSSMPAAIQATHQFLSLCPASAICMHKPCPALQPTGPHP